MRLQPLPGRIFLLSTRSNIVLVLAEASSASLSMTPITAKMSGVSAIQTKAAQFRHDDAMDDRYRAVNIRGLRVVATAEL